MQSQAAHSVFLVRPKLFGFNTETQSSNSFQQIQIDASAATCSEQARREFNGLVEVLKAHEIRVFLFEEKDDSDGGQRSPDAVFPNNWISTHHDGHIVLYPMLAKNRRWERRMDIVDCLEKKFSVTNILDLTARENDGRFLEGTGSIVFDHVNRKAYANTSPRTDVKLFREVCEYLGYSALSFRATDINGNDIYHTNVIMTIGTGYMLLCTECIPEEKERDRLTSHVKESGLDLIELSFRQVQEFAGNMLEVANRSGQRYLVMSGRAYCSLSNEQIDRLEQHVCKLIHADIPTIERLGGGSVRCMLAGVHLPAI